MFTWHEDSVAQRVTADNAFQLLVEVELALPRNGHRDFMKSVCSLARRICLGILVVLMTRVQISRDLNSKYLIIGCWINDAKMIVVPFSK